MSSGSSSLTLTPWIAASSGFFPTMSACRATLAASTPFADATRTKPGAGEGEGAGACAPAEDSSKGEETRAAAEAAVVIRKRRRVARLIRPHMNRGAGTSAPAFRQPDSSKKNSFSLGPSLLGQFLLFLF